MDSEDRSTMEGGTSATRLGRRRRRRLHRREGRMEEGTCATRLGRLRRRRLHRREGRGILTCMRTTVRKCDKGSFLARKARFRVLQSFSGRASPRTARAL